MRTALWIVVVALVVASVHGPIVRAADPPLFEQGQTYVFAWDCVPRWQADITAASVGAPGFNPCYSELLTVTAVREDGWLVVTDGLDGSTWTVNPVRAIGFTKHIEAELVPAGNRAGL